METLSRTTPTTELDDILRHLSERWRAEGLGDAVTLSFSSRLTHNFGHCKPDTGLITIASRIVDFPDVLAEVVTHEVAHVEAWRRHGAAARSHGRQWRTLMEEAGYPPRRCLPPLPGDPPVRRRSARSYLHRCPVCSAQRVGGRPVPHWRCVACHSAGRSGLLDISRLG
jgi:SprT protein